MDLGAIRPGYGGAMVCQTCNKAAFPSQQIAEREATKATDQELYVYVGPDCGWWHLTRRPQ